MQVVIQFIFELQQSSDNQWPFYEIKCLAKPSWSLNCDLLPFVLEKAAGGIWVTHNWLKDKIKWRLPCWYSDGRSYRNELLGSAEPGPPPPALLRRLPSPVWQAITMINAGSWQRPQLRVCSSMPSPAWHSQLVPAFALLLSLTETRTWGVNLCPHPSRRELG